MFSCVVQLTSAPARRNSFCKAASAALISEGISMAMKVRIFPRHLFSSWPRVSELFDQLLFAPPDFIQLLQPVFLKGLERGDDRFGHGQIAEPFFVGRDDEPRGVLRAAPVDRVFVSLSVVVPVFALFPIADRKLPVFRAIPLPFKQPLLLLFSTDVQVEFQQDR